MITTYLKQKYILEKAIFTLTISSSNPNTLLDLVIFGYPMGLNIEAMAVDNLQCILIDEDYFNKFDFIPFKDVNGNTETIKLFDENEILIDTFDAYELLIHYFENGIIKMEKTICVPYTGLFDKFGQEVLYGKGTPTFSV